MRYLPLIPVLFLVLVAGCDSADGITLDGTFQATSLIPNTGENAPDLIPAGGSLELVFGPFDGTSGTFDGRLVVPDLGEGPRSVTFDGTYDVYTAGRHEGLSEFDVLVRLSTSADVFLDGETLGLRGDLLVSPSPVLRPEDEAYVVLRRD